MADAVYRMRPLAWRRLEDRDEVRADDYYEARTVFGPLRFAFWRKHKLGWYGFGHQGKWLDGLKSCRPAKAAALTLYRKRLMAALEVVDNG